MNEVNEKRSGLSEASACSTADGSQLPKIGGRSADGVPLSCRFGLHAYRQWTVAKEGDCTQRNNDWNLVQRTQCCHCHKVKLRKLNTR